MVLQKTGVTTSALQERQIKGYAALESMGHVINREKVSLSTFSNLPNSSYGLKHGGGIRVDVGSICE